MKEKLPFINALMGLMIFFAISFQSIHSFEHLKTQLLEKECKHVYHHSKTEINHSHHDFEKCFICSFTFLHSAFLFKEQYELFVKNYTSFKKTNHFTASIKYFCEKSIQLRGPPIFMA